MPLNSDTIKSLKIPKPPILCRRPMAYRVYDPSARLFGSDPLSRRWKKAAVFRRSLFFLLTLVSGGIGGSLLHFILTENMNSVWHGPIVIIFTALFLWIAANFWIFIFGFFVYSRGGDRFDASRALASKNAKMPDNAKTCLVIPVYNEDPAPVFAELKAIYQSIERTGQLSHFNFFILSDSETPDYWVAEEAGWAALVSELGGSEVPVYYRHRRNHLQKKSGNIADFCRRWGSHYRYMIVLDADSLMSGDLATKLVCIMEARPDIGILQTVPKPVNQHSLIARAQQFAMHAYGSLFIAGFHFWQLGDGGFWGHNAILRLEPYIRFSALPKLGGTPPLGGDISSHDFVEAALLRRSGLGVWIAHDLEGSYEQLPPNLLTELDRDRRWFQGNIQHLRFLFMRGTSFGYRLLFLIGNLFYFCSFLWIASLGAETFSLIVGHFRPPDYFPARHMLSPQWPVFHAVIAEILFGMTVAFLFGPKILSIVWFLYRRESHRFGGAAKLISSVVCETVLSMLLAPIRMAFQSYYLFLTILSRKIEWKAPPRSEQRTSLLEALRAHGPSTAIAIVWGMALFMADRVFFLWALLFLVPLLSSVALSVWTSRVDIGKFFQKKGIFLIPEEIDPPRELVDFQRGLKTFAPFSISRKNMKFGFIQAAYSPEFTALHCALTRLKHRPNLRAGIARDREALIEKAVIKGARGLSKKERLRLLSDAETFGRLHHKLCELHPADAA